MSVGANEAQLDALSGYGFALGLGFQIADDVLDAIADTKKAGKATGRDKEQNKVTYLTRLGLDSAKRKQNAMQTRPVITHKSCLVIMRSSWD